MCRVRSEDIFDAHVIPAVNDFNRMQDANKDFGKMKVTLTALASNPDLLQEERVLGPADDPNNVVVKVEFKGLNAPDAEAFKSVAQAKLNFGGDKRFALSAGVGYGFIDRLEYKPIL